MAEVILQKGLYISVGEMTELQDRLTIYTSRLLEAVTKTPGIVAARNADGTIDNSLKPTATGGGSQITIAAGGALLKDSTGRMRSVILGSSVTFSTAALGDGAWELILKHVFTNREKYGNDQKSNAFATLSVTGGNATISNDGTYDFTKTCRSGMYILIEDSVAGNNGTYKILSITNASQLVLQTAMPFNESNLKFELGGQFTTAYVPGTLAGKRLYNNDYYSIGATQGSLGAGDYKLAFFVTSGGTIDMLADDRGQNLFEISGILQTTMDGTVQNTFKVRKGDATKQLTIDTSLLTENRTVDGENLWKIIKQIITDKVMTLVDGTTASQFRINADPNTPGSGLKVLTQKTAPGVPNDLRVYWGKVGTNDTGIPITNNTIPELSCWIKVVWGWWGAGTWVGDVFTPQSGVPPGGFSVNAYVNQYITFGSDRIQIVSNTATSFTVGTGLGKSGSGNAIIGVAADFYEVLFTDAAGRYLQYEVAAQSPALGVDDVLGELYIPVFSTSISYSVQVRGCNGDTMAQKSGWTSTVSLNVATASVNMSAINVATNNVDGGVDVSWQKVQFSSSGQGGTADPTRYVIRWTSDGTSPFGNTAVERYIPVGTTHPTSYHIPVGDAPAGKNIRVGMFAVSFTGTESTRVEGSAVSGGGTSGLGTASVAYNNLVVATADFGLNGRLLTIAPFGSNVTIVKMSFLVKALDLNGAATAKIRWYPYGSSNEAQYFTFVATNGALLSVDSDMPITTGNSGMVIDAYDPNNDAGAQPGFTVDVTIIYKEMSN